MHLLLEDLTPPRSILQCPPPPKSFWLSHHLFGIRMWCPCGRRFNASAWASGSSHKRDAATLPKADQKGMPGLHNSASCSALQRCHPSGTPLSLHHSSGRRGHIPFPIWTIRFLGLQGGPNLCRKQAIPSSPIIGFLSSWVHNWRSSQRWCQYGYTGVLAPCNQPGH